MPTELIQWHIANGNRVEAIDERLDYTDQHAVADALVLHEANPDEWPPGVRDSTHLLCCCIATLVGSLAREVGGDEGAAWWEAWQVTMKVRKIGRYAPSGA
tara:strand:+ start:643 stop:945 length:303 start_codon:yes stop_codon:yes gene_type:complete